jgi:hypothetical protein
MCSRFDSRKWERTVYGFGRLGHTGFRPKLGSISLDRYDIVRTCWGTLTTRYFFKKLQKILQEVFPDAVELHRDHYLWETTA